MTTRQQIMDFFRSDDFQEHLTTDDAIEIFVSVLKGESDLTKELFQDLCNDYGTSLDAVINQ